MGILEEHHNRTSDLEMFEIADFSSNKKLKFFIHSIICFGQCLLLKNMPDNSLRAALFCIAML